MIIIFYEMLHLLNIQGDLRTTLSLVDMFVLMKESGLVIF